MMRIAAAEQNGQIFRHFGETPAFMLYDIADGRIVSSSQLLTGEISHGALVDLLKQNNVNVLIAGGIGMGAKQRCEAAGITMYGGCSGDCEKNVQDYLNGALHYDPLAAEHHGPCHH